MAKARNNLVCLKVHSSYFDKVFEPQRKSMENKLGYKLTQGKFTEILSNAKIKVTWPKRDNIFAPKKNKKKGGLQFNF